MIKSIHHVSFAVWDLEAAIARFERVLGVKVSERGPVSSRGAEVAIFNLEGASLEIVAPTSREGSLQKHLEEHGEGFFHLAFGVDDIDRGYRELKQRGIAMQGPPYQAYKDWRIAYLDAGECGGISTHIIGADAQ